MILILNRKCWMDDALREWFKSIWRVHREKIAFQFSVDVLVGSVLALSCSKRAGNVRKSETWQSEGYSRRWQWRLLPDFGFYFLGSKKDYFYVCPGAESYSKRSLGLGLEAVALLGDPSIRSDAPAGQPEAALTLADLLLQVTNSEETWIEVSSSIWTGLRFPLIDI